jgi:hypothetical protein
MVSTFRTNALTIVLSMWLVSVTVRNFVYTSEFAALDRTSCDLTALQAVGSSSQKYILVESPSRLDVIYQSASSEEYAVVHAKELGYLVETQAELTPSCNLFKDPNLTVHVPLHQYRMELQVYATRVRDFKTNITDLRTPLRQGTMTRDVLCSTVDLGLADIFSGSQQLSHGSFGYAEPIIPPLRHPDFCYRKPRGMSLDFLVHDWKVMCQRLTPFSQTVFIDMGASLTYHNGNSQEVKPAVYILETYKRFGIVFDHVYAYEVTQQAPDKVFQLVPDDLFPNYHWINVGVDADPNGKMNPLRMLLNKYTEDDFIVIKLDIDTGKFEITFKFQLDRSRKNH